MCVTFANSLETVDLKLCANPSEASSWNCHPHFLLHPPTNRAENQQSPRLCIWLCICLFSCILQNKLRMIKFRIRLRSRTNVEINLLSASITPLSRHQRRISFKTKCVKSLLKKNSFASQGSCQTKKRILYGQTEKGGVIPDICHFFYMGKIFGE